MVNHLVISPLIPVQNREGLFVVTTPEVAKKIREGYMKVFAQRDTIRVETITRARADLAVLGEYQVVFVAIDQNGILKTAP